MPEELSASDKIVNIWLSDDKEDLTVTKERIKAVREQYQHEHPTGDYPDVLRTALRKLTDFHQQKLEVEALTPEDFND